MRGAKLIGIVLIPILLIPLVSASDLSVPPYDSWYFEAQGENTFSVENSTAHLLLKNGVATLYTYLPGHIKKGTIFILNITVSLSPATVVSGIKVMMGNDTLLNEKLSEDRRKYSLQIFALKDYEKGAKFSIIIYNLGGEISAVLAPVRLEIPRGGIETGLLLTGVGISTVFLVLGILAAVMYLMKPRERRREKGEKEKIKKREVRKEVIASQKSEVDEETVAAIAGALSLYLGGKKFRIVSVKPSPWKYYGRLKALRRWK